MPKVPFADAARILEQRHKDLSGRYIDAIDALRVCTNTLQTSLTSLSMDDYVKARAAIRQARCALALYNVLDADLGRRKT